MMVRPLRIPTAAIAAVLVAKAPAQGQNLAVTELARFPAVEARQGVVADSKYFYAIDNATIGKYDRRTGRRIAQWQGASALFKHMNSCILKGSRIVCAASNYPEVPQTSSVETFDFRRMQHVATHSFGLTPGSLTWIDWHDGSWWACFANYDGKGGEPGRDHRATILVRYSADFRETGSWVFPPEVLGRFAPYSASGGAWGDDGLLYVTGHDRPELYALRLPSAGSTLQHVATLATPTGGQAIAWQVGARRVLWSIDRKALAVVASQVPAVVLRQRR